MPTNLYRILLQDLLLPGLLLLTAASAAPAAPQNTAPAAHDLAAATDEDTPVDLTLSGEDPDGDPLSYTLLSFPAHGSLSGTPPLVRYSPGPDFFGSDGFSFQVDDGQATSAPAQVSLAVAPVNDPPQAVDDSYAGDAGSPLNLAAGLGVLANDSDVEGDALSAVLLGPPSHGTLQFYPDGSFDYTPEPGFSGSDQFSYAASDGAVSSAPAQATLAIQAVNEAPTAIQLDNTSVAENQPAGAAVGTLSTSDPDPGDTHTYTLVAGAGSADNALFTIQGSTLQTQASFDYELKNTYSVRVQSTDAGGLSVEASFAIQITGVNEAPAAASDSYTTQEDQAYSVPAPGVLANDADPEGDTLTVQVDTQPAHGSLALQANGAFTYTPQAGYHGSDSFTYRAGDGALSSGVATVGLTITSVNDPPVAQDDSANSKENQPVKVNVLANDSDPDGAADLNKASLSVTQAPAHGTVKVDAGEGNLTYTPQEGFAGDDSFEYRICDLGGLCDKAQVQVTVEAVNSPPSASGEVYKVTQGQVLQVASPGVLGNDSDPDGDKLTAILNSGPAHGALELKSNGAFTYTPDATFNGSDSFRYHAWDGAAASETVKVTLTVEFSDLEPPQVNWIAPVATGERYDVDGRPVVLQVQASDNVGVQEVLFYRWDSQAEAYVDVAQSGGPTFSAQLDSLLLTPGWNQIFVKAYDAAGHESDREFIWLYTNRVYLPFSVH